MSETPRITTAEELLRAGDIGRCELIRGELIMMSPSGFRHGIVVATLTRYLSVHVDAHALGAVVGAESGYVVARSPDTVRAPDISFVEASRVSAVADGGFGQAAPDLAVEVLSPDDRPLAVAEKVACWLDAGCRAVWAVDPQTRTIATHDDSGSTSLVEGDTLTGGDVVAGFAMPVSSVFADLPG